MNEIHLNTKQTEQFWNNIDIKGEDDCWLYKGNIFQSGYGRYKSFRAHRIAWTLTYGEIPEGMMVCHTCDRRDCVSPFHLFLGTNKDNMADMVAKGRSSRGETNHFSKLTEADVIHIKWLFTEGLAEAKELAKMYGVTWRSIYRITAGKCWGHISKGVIC